MNNPEIPTGTTVHINPEEIKWNANGDLISREALKKAFKAWKEMDDYYHNTDCIDIPFSEAFDLIDNAPIVRNEYMRGYEAAMREYKRPQGEWILNKEMSITCSLWNCSVCNRLNGNDSFNFCPNCGAICGKVVRNDTID